jgi:hypothetical protein
MEDDPIERIIGAAFWSTEEGIDGGPTIHPFDWRFQPSHAGSDTEVGFLRELTRLIGETQAAGVIKTRRLFSESDDAVPALLQAGFGRYSTIRVFEGVFAEVTERHERLRRAFGTVGHGALVTMQPAPSHLADIVRLAAEGERLLSAEEIAGPLRHADGSGLYDPEWSTVLYDGEKGRVVGVQLVRVRDGVMAIPALVVDADAGVPGLGWFLIYSHWAELCRERGWDKNFICRINPAANPTMLKMSGLFGYRLIGETHSYAIGGAASVPT